jgi:hypothetical protein
MDTPMKTIRVKTLSPAVMSRARNGHKVRLMKGEGTQLVVHENQYSQINKAFLRNKGVRVALSPSEIIANKTVEGEGIFGKKADKVMKKLGVKKVAYAVGSVVKPLAKEGIDAAAMMATAYGVPPSVTEAMSTTANQYLDDPKSLQGKKGVKALKKKAIDVGIRAAQPYADEYGIDLGEMKSALETAGTKRAGVPMTKAAVRAKGETMMLGKLQELVDSRRAKSAPMSTDLYDQMDRDGIIGNGMMGHRCPTCSGSGLYAGAASGRGIFGADTKTPMRMTKKYVNMSRKLMGGELQALSSQAADANYAFRNTM